MHIKKSDFHKKEYQERTLKGKIKKAKLKHVVLH